MNTKFQHEQFHRSIVMQRTRTFLWSLAVAFSACGSMQAQEYENHVGIGSGTNAQGDRITTTSRMGLGRARIGPAGRDSASPTISGPALTNWHGIAWSYSDPRRMTIGAEGAAIGTDDVRSHHAHALARWSDELTFRGGEGQGTARIRVRVTTRSTGEGATQATLSFNNRPIASGEDLTGEYAFSVSMFFHVPHRFEFELAGPTSPAQAMFELDTQSRQSRSGSVTHIFELLTMDLFNAAGWPIEHGSIEGGDGRDISPNPWCEGDANGDRMIDITDLQMVLGNFNQPGLDGDVNSDGVVNFRDLEIVLGHFSTNCDG